jgi:hypothetical protein
VEYRPDVDACAECGASLQPCVAGALTAVPPTTGDLEAALSGPPPQFHPLLLSPDLEEDLATANRRRLAWDTAREIATMTCHECREPVEPDPTAIDLWRCTGCGLTFTGEVHGIVL